MLALAGPDAVAFAQAQFSNDVVALPAGHWQWNAWLSPQGRVRYFFALLRDTQDHLQVLLRGGDAEGMRTALTRFVFRAKLSLHTLAGMQALGCDEAEALAELGSVPAGDFLVHENGRAGLRLPGQSPRWLLLRPAAGPIAAASPEALNYWRLDDIRSGLPELAPALQDHMLPQWLGLSRLHAVSVDKGCYPGQEIMARMHFKGGNKRGLYRLQLRCADLPAPGTSLVDAGQEAGAVVMAAWSSPGHAEALAVIVDAASAGVLRTHPANADEVKVVSGFA